MPRQPEGTPDAAATSALEQTKPPAPEVKPPAVTEVKTPSTPEVALPDVYAIAENCAITTLRGTLTAGAQVFARDFPHDGAKTLRSLIANGSVVRR